MPKTGQKVITVSGVWVKKLQEAYDKEKEKRPALSFAAFISESAIMELERRNILKEAQFISLVAIEDNVIILKDFRKNERFVEVYLNNNKLTCNIDQKDCIHVGFALALPEVRKKLNS